MYIDILYIYRHHYRHPHKTESNISSLVYIRNRTSYMNRDFFFLILYAFCVPYALRLSSSLSQSLNLNIYVYFYVQDADTYKHIR